MQGNGLGMCGVEAERMLGQLRLEAGMLSREGTGSLKRKRKLEHVNSRQKKNYTKPMNYDQLAA